MNRPRSVRASVPLFSAFAAVVLSFVAATAFEHWRLVGIDRASIAIADSAAPSIEHLTTARSELRNVQVLLRAHLDRKGLGQASDPHPVEAARASMATAISAYLALHPFPDEKPLWTKVVRGEDEYTAAVAHCLAEAERGDIHDAELLWRTEVLSSAERFGLLIARDVELNAAHAHDLAMKIRTLREQSTYVAFGLDAACALIALAGALALHRAMRAHASLVESHHKLLEERASELEQFAGSVAHDILSPLNSVGLALELAGRPGEEQARAGWVRRGVSSLARVERLVNGLLEFARAGAHSGKDAQCSVALTIADLAPDLEAAATEASAELVVDLRTRRHVGCNAGVLTSMVSNLARNAIKYIGDGPIRRIEVRASDRDDWVLVEVSDTGPGLAPGLEKSVFEPYVRGPHATQPGIGLGLATVKRLVEAHGGKVGVTSVMGRGCTFWFELPRYGEGDPKGDEGKDREESDALLPSSEAHI